MRPDATRWAGETTPDVLLLSLPLAEADELTTPRADAKLYIELMLTRWLALASEKEERLPTRRAGSGR